MADDRDCSPSLVSQGPICGNLRYVIYSFTNDSDDTGGTIVTGMKKVLAAFVQNGTTAAKGAKVEINTDESGSTDGSVKITINAGDDGLLFAVGYGVANTRD